MLVVAAARTSPKLLPVLLTGVATLVFALIIDVPVRYLETRGVRRSLGVSLVSVVLGGSIFGLVLLIGPSVVRQAHALSSPHNDLARALALRANQFAARLPVKFSKLVPGDFSVTKLYHLFGGPSLVLSAAEVAGAIIAAFFTAVWAVASPGPLVGRLLDFVPAGSRERVSEVTATVVTALKRWVVGQVVLDCVVGAATYVLLVALGMPFAVLFSVLAAVLEAVPNLGVLISAGGPVAIAAVVYPGRVLPLVAGFVIIHQLEGRLLAPVVMRKAVNLHPSLLTFVLLISGTVLGPWGLVIAVPLTITVFVVHDALRDTSAGPGPALVPVPDPRPTPGPTPCTVPGPGPAGDLSGQ